MAKYLYTLLVCSICSAKIWFGGTPNTLFIVTNDIAYFNATNKICRVDRLDIFGVPYTSTYTTNSTVANANQIYRGLGPDNILVLCLSNDVESLKSASIATSLWGSSSILMLNDSNIRMCIPSYSTGARAILPRPTNDVHMIAMTNQYDALYGDDLHSWNFYYAWSSNEMFLSDFVAPITDHLAKYRQYRVLACAYKIPHRTIPQDDNHGNSTINDFFDNSYGYPYKTQTNITMFSFSCRTFEDTSNLLYFANEYDMFEAWSNAWYVWDTGYGQSEDYWKEVAFTTNVLYRTNEVSAATRITNAPGSVCWVFSRGLHDLSLTNLDSMWRNLFAFNTLPNSMAGSLESYNMSSYRRGYDARTHQTRLYDCFDKECNRDSYSKIYGCAAGHVSEPGYYPIAPSNMFSRWQAGDSFVDAIYKSNNEWRWWTIHIVCGHPFLRLKQGE